MSNLYCKGLILNNTNSWKWYPDKMPRRWCDKDTAKILTPVVCTLYSVHDQMQ